MKNPLDPKPGDGDLLAELLANEQRVRNWIIVAESFAAVLLEGDVMRATLTDCAAAVRVLYNAIKQEVHQV